MVSRKEAILLGLLTDLLLGCRSVSFQISGNKIGKFSEVGKKKSHNSSHLSVHYGRFGRKYAQN
jgi:hypothetical protein